MEVQVLSSAQYILARSDDLFLYRYYKVVDIRKPTSLVLGAVFISIVFVGIPLLLISLNNYFNLPIYTNGYLKIIGAVFIVVGFSVVVNSTVLQIKTGRTTPLPVIEHPKQFIAKGLYKYCRNPMYASEVFIFLGAFLLLGYILLLLYVLVAFLVMHVLVVYIEEPELRRMFGEEYVSYSKKVPRWIPDIKIVA